MKKLIYAIIPARGGSRGIPKKNILSVGDFPLIAYSIAAVHLSKKIDRIIVSTDSSEIAEIALKFGAEVPYLRPKKFATSKSPDIEFVKHALGWFEKKEGLIPDFFVHIRPTTPLRKPEMIDKAVEHLLRNKLATSLRSVHELRESPYKLFALKRGYLTGLFPGDPRPEYYNLPRQFFQPAYQPNGYVDILISRYVLESNSLHGDRILGFVTEDPGEIDRKEDLEKVNYFLRTKKYKILDYLKKSYKK